MSMINVVVMGDRSRYSFLGEIVRQIPIPKSKLGDTDIIVTQLDTEDGVVDNKAIELKSTRLPIATKIIFPANNANIQNYADKAVAVFYFEEFGFRKLKTTHDLDTIRHIGFPSVAVILYAPPRKFLDSDISTYNDDIENAKAKYKEDGYRVIEYKPGTSTLPLIIQLQTDLFTNCHRVRMLNKIAEKREELYDEYGLKLDYELMQVESGFSPQDNKIINRYDEKEFALATVDSIYFERARKLIFDYKRIELLEPLFNLYKSFVKPIAFWDLKQDVNILEEKMQKEFYKSTYIEHNIVFRGTRNEYENYINTSRIDTEFLKRVNEFIGYTLYVVIVHHIERRLNKLEELAKGG